MSQATVTPVGRASGTIQVTISPLVIMAVKLYTSCSDMPGSGLNQACPTCLEPAKSPNTCETHGKLDSVTKVFRDGEISVEITEEDLQALKALPTYKNFMPQAMVRTSLVRNLMSQSYKKYYLLPDGKMSDVLYAGLIDQLGEYKVLIGKYSLTTGRENLSIIQVENGHLVLMHVPFNNIQRPQPTAVLPELNDANREMMKKILNQIPKAFDYDAMEDSYDDILRVVVGAKVEAKLKEQVDQFIPMKKVRVRKSEDAITVTV